VEQILKGEPWSFDKHLVVLKRVKKHSDISKLLFETTSMWIQLHNLPIEIPMSTAKSIVFEVGMMIECTPGEELYEGSNFICIRVGVDVTKLLCQGQRITFRSG